MTALFLYRFKHSSGVRQGKHNICQMVWQFLLFLALFNYLAAEAIAALAYAAPNGRMAVREGGLRKKRSEHGGQLSSCSPVA